MRELNLASCKLSTIPDLSNKSYMDYLDLSDNQISGKVPIWIWEVGNRNLEYLNLSHNLLVGLHKPYLISNLTALKVLDLNSNLLQGKMPLPPSSARFVDYSSNLFSSIPAQIGDFLSSATFFSLSNNSLKGVIPESICNAPFLKVADLSSNKLSGTIPTCLIERSGTLAVLNLRRNNLTGTISDAFSGSCELLYLNVNGNQLEGMVPKSLANCIALALLDLGNNQISDNFPCWLKSISSLRVLILRSNKFYGNIGCSQISGSWAELQILDLASNNFSGRLPRKGLTTWKAMMVHQKLAQQLVIIIRDFLSVIQWYYYQNAITVTSKGHEIELVKILTMFTSIDLSCNHFHGPIPEEIGILKSLYILNLSHNSLTGQIPSSIGNLRQLESLDLAVNSLSGAITTELASLNFLSVLNLSYNHFVGQIPLGTQLQTFSTSSFEGNEGLCGPPLTNNCTNSSKLLPSAPNSITEIDWRFVLMAVGFAIGFGATVSPLTFSKNVNKWYDVRINRFLK